MTQVRTYVETATPSGVWVDLLRANCLTLVDRPQIAKAVSISRAFHRGTEDEREGFIALAQRMAEEYGLQVEIEMRGHFLSLRFTRRQDEAAEAATPTPSIFRRLGALLASRRRPAEETEEGTDRAVGSSTEVRHLRA